MRVRDVVRERESAEEVRAGRQFVVNFAAGLAGYLGPGAGALAVGSVPLVLAALDHVSKTSDPGGSITLSRR